MSRYVFVKKCAIRIDKKQKERYGKKYCHHSPSIEESLLQDAVMRAIMQTAKQNVEVLKTLKIHIGMGLTDEVTEDKTLDIQIRIAEINTEFQKLLKAVSADNADGIDEERITELMNEKQRLTVQLEQYAAMRQKRESAKSRLDEIYTILDGLQNHPSGVVFLFVPVVLALLSRRETASEKKKIAAAASSRRRDSPAG